MFMFNFVLYALRVIPIRLVHFLCKPDSLMLYCLVDSYVGFPVLDGGDKVFLFEFFDVNDYVKINDLDHLFLLIF